MVGFITGTIIIYLYKVIDRSIFKQAFLSVFGVMVKIALPLVIGTGIYLYGLLKISEWFGAYTAIAVSIFLSFAIPLIIRYIQIIKRNRGGNKQCI